MTLQEKAKEIVDKFSKSYGEKRPDGKIDLCIVSIGRAKQCALIAVDEILNFYKNDIPQQDIEYWQQVKEEIQKL